MEVVKRGRFEMTVRAVNTRVDRGIISSPQFIIKENGIPILIYNYDIENLTALMDQLLIRYGKQYLKMFKMDTLKLIAEAKTLKLKSDLFVNELETLLHSVKTYTTSEYAFMVGFRKVSIFVNGICLFDGFNGEKDKSYDLYLHLSAVIRAFGSLPPMIGCKRTEGTYDHVLNSIKEFIKIRN